MAYLENGIFCGFEEYKQERPYRVTEQNLRCDDLYSMSVLLDSELAKYSAAKLAVRLLRKVGNNIEVSFLDEDLNSVSDSDGSIYDGIVTGITTTVVVCKATSARFRIKEGFFKDFFEDQFGDFLVEANSLTV